MLLAESLKISGRHCAAASAVPRKLKALTQICGRAGGRGRWHQREAHAASRLCQTRTFIERDDDLTTSPSTFHAVSGLEERKPR